MAIDNYDDPTVETVEAQIETLPLIVPPRWVNGIGGLLAIDPPRPRDIKKSISRMVVEADIAGEGCYYSWMVFDKKKNKKVPIAGPSIEAALIALRNWGNCICFPLPTEEVEDAFIMNAVFIDLETKAMYARPYRLAKKINQGFKTDENRKDDMSFGIGQSKCHRNVIRRGIPNYCFDEIIAQAQKGVAKRLDELIETKGIVVVRDQIIDSLAQLGVSAARAELKVGLRVKDWDKTHLILLRGDIKTLKDGMEEVDEMFPPVEEKGEGPTLSQGKKKETTDPALKAKLVDSIGKFVSENAGAFPKGAAEVKYSQERLNGYSVEALTSLCAEIQRKVELYNARVAKTEQPAGDSKAGEGTEGEETPQV